VDPEGRQVIRSLIASERDRGCALLVTTHELTEAERSSDRVIIMNRGRVIIHGTLDELAGAPEMIIELSGPVNATQLAATLGCAITSDTPTQLRCAIESTPERISTLNDFLANAGVTMLSLRTRASLEERYLELIERERHEVRP
jgi:ABC-2 type transport system ATP-binding protein